MYSTYLNTLLFEFLKERRALYLLFGLPGYVVDVALDGRRRKRRGNKKE